MHRPLSARYVVLLAAMLTLTACSARPPESAYLNRGGPEALLDVSSEVVNLGTGSTSELQDLSNWIDKDQPTRAELHCNASDRNCSEAEKVLELHAVPTIMGAAGDNSVTLIYERILARDCNQRYVEDGTNDYNAPHPAFGCSISANIVQQVSDKQEFISPNISDNPAAARSVGDMKNASVPRPVPALYTVTTGITKSSSN